MNIDLIDRLNILEERDVRQREALDAIYHAMTGDVKGCGFIMSANSMSAARASECIKRHVLVKRALRIAGYEINAGELTF